MSRSYKHQPFAAICGGSSAHHDKTLAARGVRRAHRQTMHIALHNGEYEVILPHRLQCSHNEVYTWVRDGHQRWQGLDHRDWQRYLEATNPDLHDGHRLWYNDERYTCWPPTWYEEMMRK